MHQISEKYVVTGAVTTKDYFDKQPLHVSWVIID